MAPPASCIAIDDERVTHRQIRTVQTLPTQTRFFNPASHQEQHVHSAPAPAAAGPRRRRHECVRVIMCGRAGPRARRPARAGRPGRHFNAYPNTHRDGWDGGARTESNARARAGRGIARADLLLLLRQDPTAGVYRAMRLFALPPLLLLHVLPLPPLADSTSMPTHTIRSSRTGPGRHLGCQPSGDANATASCLQAAFDAALPHDIVEIPFTGDPWVVSRPLFLRKNDITLHLLPGVIIE